MEENQTNHSETAGTLNNNESVQTATDGHQNATADANTSIEATASEETTTNVESTGDDQVTNETTNTAEATSTMVEAPTTVEVPVTDAPNEVVAPEVKEPEVPATKVEAIAETQPEAVVTTAEQAVVEPTTVAQPVLAADELDVIALHEQAMAAEQVNAAEVRRQGRKYYEEPSATAHDDFDWSVDKRNVATYTADDRIKYDKVYDNTFKSINENEVMNGIIVGMTKTDVIINIGFKSDGLISMNEFRDAQINIGDQIEVMVVEKEDRDGHLHLSRKLARAARSWQQIVDFYKTGEVVTGTITSKTKGGLIVDVHGLETFLPGSQIDVKPVTDYDQYVGKTMDFKVVKINETIRNAVVSHKALIESDIEQQRSVIIGQLEKGQVLEGTVKNVTDFGAFIDLGGVDGLLYITDISWGRVTHPSEVLHNSQKINVVVLDFDDEKKRISLGLKQLTPHPWDNLPEEIIEGGRVKGKVVNIEDYGAFLEILPGVEGLVHVSEITWSSQPINAKEFFKINEEHEAVVVTLDKDERKMSLSIKQMTNDPWETIENRFPIDSRHKGTVKNITPYGVFVELETGIGGMIHISDLSWIKRYNHPSEFIKAGEVIDIIILGIDKDNRKLSLGHKQLEEDPWNAFETVFPIGSIHEGSVTRKDEKGANVQLQYGLEAYAPARHLRKEDGENVEAEETLPFMIIEFDRNDKRILVSHSKVWEQVKNEEKEAARKEVVNESEKTKKAVKNLQSKVEKPTLGDLGALASIKDKLMKAEEEAAGDNAAAEPQP